MRKTNADDDVRAWDSSEIARRKQDFQDENRRQMREGLLPLEDASFISREAAQTATFRFKT